jgi:plasmid replication initiation protein
MQGKIRMVKKHTEFREMEQLNLFWPADFQDVNFRGERNILSIPFCSLEKRKRIRPIVYKEKDVEVKISGDSEYGIATIWDMDVILFLISQINEAIEKNVKTSRQIDFIAHQFFSQCRWVKEGQKSGRAYKRLEKSLDRLQSTGIKTNIKSGGKCYTSKWSWLSEWHRVEDSDGKMIGLRVVLSEWLYDKVVKERSVLSIHPDYFRIKSGNERQLYRIIRKMVGKNPVWKFSIEALFKRFPSGKQFRYFKSDLKKIVERNSLPEYKLTWHEEERIKGVQCFVIVVPRPGAIEERKLPKPLRGLLPWGEE